MRGFNNTAKKYRFTFLDYLWWIGEKAGMTSYARRMDGSTMLSLYYLTYIYYPTLIIAAEVGHRAVSLAIYAFISIVFFAIAFLIAPKAYSGQRGKAVERHYRNREYNAFIYTMVMAGIIIPLIAFTLWAIRPRPVQPEPPSSDRHENIQQILNRHNNCVLYFFKTTERNNLHATVF